jgi:uncharacterized protein YqgV (UPF0045/DUF77 family)
MHQFIVNASLQIVPIVRDRHPYEWVDEAIEVIKSSGIRHEVGPFATVLEGRYEEVLAVIGAVNEWLYTRHCSEWICQVQIQIRSAGDITSAEKTDKYLL